jgi:hypothetical protein
VSYNYKPDRETHAFRCTVLSISAYRMCISLSLSVLSVERERWRLIVGRREMKKIEEISGIEHLVRSKKRERERERESFCWSLEQVRCSMHSLPLQPILLCRFHVSSIPKHAKTQHINFLSIPRALSLSLLLLKKTNKTIFRKQFKQCQTLLCKYLFSFRFCLWVSEGKSFSVFHVPFTSYFSHNVNLILIQTVNKELGLRRFFFFFFDAKINC